MLDTTLSVDTSELNFVHQGEKLHEESIRESVDCRGVVIINDSCIANGAEQIRR